MLFGNYIITYLCKIKSLATSLKEMYALFMPHVDVLLKRYILSYFSWLYCELNENQITD